MRVCWAAFAVASFVAVAHPEGRQTPASFDKRALQALGFAPRDSAFSIFDTSNASRLIQPYVSVNPSLPWTADLVRAQSLSAAPSSGQHVGRNTGRPPLLVPSQTGRYSLNDDPLISRYAGGDRLTTRNFVRTHDARGADFYAAAATTARGHTAPRRSVTPYVEEHAADSPETTDHGTTTMLGAKRPSHHGHRYSHSVSSSGSSTQERTVSIDGSETIRTPQQPSPSYIIDRRTHVPDGLKRPAGSSAAAATFATSLSRPAEHSASARVAGDADETTAAIAAAAAAGSSAVPPVVENKKGLLPATDDDDDSDQNDNNMRLNHHDARRVPAREEFEHDLAAPRNFGIYGDGAKPDPAQNVYAYCYPFTDDQIVSKCSLATEFHAMGVYIPMMMDVQFKHNKLWYSQLRRLRGTTGLDLVGVAFERPNWPLILEILRENKGLFAGVLLEWIGDGACISKIGLPSVEDLNALRALTTKGILRYLVREQNFNACPTQDPSFLGTREAVKPLSELTDAQLEEQLQTFQQTGFAFPSFIQPVFSCFGGQEGLCYKAFNKDPTIACGDGQRYIFNPYEAMSGRLMHMFNETCAGLPPHDLYGAL